MAVNISERESRGRAGDGARRSVNNVNGALNSMNVSADPNDQEKSGGVDIDFTDIAHSAKKAGVLMQKSALASSNTLVERETLKLVIEEHGMRFSGCLLLPFTLLFFIFYAGAARMHEDITQTHLMESPIRDKFNPVLDEEGGESATTDMLGGLVTLSDWYHFMKTVYVPTVFNDKDAYGQELAPKERGRQFMYNNLIGAVVLEQQRSIAEACKDDEASHMMCYPMNKKSSSPFGKSWTQLGNASKTKYRGGADPIIKCDEEGFQAFNSDTGACPGVSAVQPAGNATGGRRLLMLRDELKTKMPKLAKENNEKFKFFLFQNQRTSSILERINYLEKRGWLDHQTTSVSAKMLYLNNELDIPRLDTMNIVFYISRGGGIYVSLRMEAIFLKSFSRTMTYFFDAIFLLMLIFSTIFITFSLCKACKDRLIKYHFTAVNVITWLTVIMGWINVLGLYVLTGMRKDITGLLEDVWKVNDYHTVTKLTKRTDDFVFYATWYRVFVADAHIVFMMRCFIALQWQPRLAVVTHTLVETSTDLFHFLIVFVPTFIAFSIAGNEMFGRRMSQFSTIEGSICVCFKLAMESEFDWWGFSEEDFLTALSWVWLYILLVVLLMLNMVLAIIMDVYSTIRLQAGNSETVWANIYFLGCRAYYMRQWISDEILLEKIQDLPRTVSIAEFQEAIPEMVDYQMNRITEGCFIKAQAVMRMGVHDSYSAQMTAATKIGLDGISADIAELKDKGWMGRGVEAGSLPERMLAQDVLQCAAAQNHWMGLMKSQLEILRKKTVGLAEMANLLVTFYSASNLPLPCDCYMTCHVTGKQGKSIRSRTVEKTNNPEWNQELELEGYDVKNPKPLQFNIYDESVDPPAPMVAAKLPTMQFMPDGFEGELAFPGGVMSIKVEVTNPQAETTV